MNQAIAMLFDFLGKNFNKIPVLNKLIGYRAVIGYIGLAITTALAVKGVISHELALPILAGFEAFKDLSLNAKGRSPEIAGQ